jgi:hypothetical protein
MVKLRHPPDVKVYYQIVYTMSIILLLIIIIIFIIILCLNLVGYQIQYFYSL